MKSFLYVLMAGLIVIGCSKTNTILFCEGVSPDGEGVNCGKKFEDGELTALVVSEGPFLVEKISVQVDAVNADRKEKVEVLSVDVQPERQRVPVNLSFYTGGRYTVRASAGDRIIGEETVEIVER